MKEVKEVRELVNTVLALACIITLILSIPVLATTQREYMTVTYTARQSGEVEVIDANGNLWAFKGYGFQKGERVIVDMFNNNTPDNIYDDQILNVRKLY